MLEYRIYQCTNERCEHFGKQVPIHLLDEICTECGHCCPVRFYCGGCDEPMVPVRLCAAWEAAFLEDALPTC